MFATATAVAPTTPVFIEAQPAIQRPLRGSRISTFYPVKSLPSLSSLDSAFQLQEYISLLIRLDVHDVEAITSLPGSVNVSAKEESKEKDKEKEGEKEKEVAVDEACWIYEQLRRLAQDLTHPLITTLQQECSSETCPEMKAGEWLYLCVAHGNDGSVEQCCAIDYILHTLDSATALLNSPRAFPSRLQIPQSSHRHFSSLARRLGRIFAHAYYHHREAFEQAEAESSLYARFLALSSKYDLVPAEFLVIPPLAVSGTSGEGDDDREERPEGGGEEGGERAAVGEDEEGREGGYGGKFDTRRLLGPGQNQSNTVPGLYPKTRIPQPQHTHLQPRSQSYVVQPQHSQHRRDHTQSYPQLTGRGQELLQTQNVGTGTGGVDSPRRIGRNRTDTMVHSEVMTVVDDLARAAREKEVEREKEKEKESEEEKEPEEDKEPGEEKEPEEEKEFDEEKDSEEQKEPEEQEEPEVVEEPEMVGESEVMKEPEVVKESLEKEADEEEKKEEVDEEEKKEEVESSSDIKAEEKEFDDRVVDEPAPVQESSDSATDKTADIITLETRTETEVRSEGEDKQASDDDNEISESEAEIIKKESDEEGGDGSETEEMETATENSDDQSEGDDDDSEDGTEAELETASEGEELAEDEGDEEKRDTK